MSKTFFTEVFSPKLFVTNVNHITIYQNRFKAACRVQTCKEPFCQNSDKFRYSFIKNDMFMYLLCIYEKLIISSFFKLDTLNLTMYILRNLTCLLKIYVIRLRNLISMNIFFTMKDHSFSSKLQRESRKQIIKNLDFFKFNFNNVFFTTKDENFVVVSIFPIF